MLSAARKLGSLDISVMDEIDSEARMDGGDVLYTGVQPGFTFFFCSKQATSLVLITLRNSRFVS